MTGRSSVRRHVCSVSLAYIFVVAPLVNEQPSDEDDRVDRLASAGGRNRDVMVDAYGDNDVHHEDGHDARGLFY